ncbi:HAMP domain-containing histidine kinase [bacterium]|nr:HAMP domain-containing histidine kinase [bacterium]
MPGQPENDFNSNKIVDTYFATAQRASDEVLENDIRIISKNPIVDSLMKIVTGIMLVLNEYRQILTVNDAMLNLLGINDISEIMGCRPGEAINCVHSREHPGGCGTSKFCATCGAVIAMVASLDSNKPEQRICAATVEKMGRTVDLYFMVRSYPVTFENRRFLLLFLQDITVQQQQALLERAFFHDIQNTISALMLSSAMLESKTDLQSASTILDRIKRLTNHLEKGIQIQKVLSYEETGTYNVALQEVSINALFYDIKEIFETHPVAKGKRINFPKAISNILVQTDYSLLQRILVNMLVNALEATPDGGEIKLWLEENNGAVTFKVWNKKAIPPKIALRVFQRNFSTKAETGRGLGTYTMKLFGETYLNGSVDFSSSKEDGTVFWLTLPK